MAALWYLEARTGVCVSGSSASHMMTMCMFPFVLNVKSVQFLEYIETKQLTRG